MCTYDVYLFILIIMLTSYGRFIKLYQSSSTRGSDAVLTPSAMFLGPQRRGSRALGGRKVGARWVGEQRRWPPAREGGARPSWKGPR